MGAVKGKGTREDPWLLTTPPGGSEYQAFRDETLDPPALVAMVGKTEVRYHLRCLDDLHAMLKAHGDWMPLGNADEQKPAADGTVEAWARSAREPGRRVVRAQEGIARPVRELRAAGARGARSGRGRAPAAEQPHARDLTRVRHRSKKPTMAMSVSTPWSTRASQSRFDS